MGAAYSRGRPHLAPPTLSFPVVFLWHQRGKWKWKEPSSVFWEDYQAFIENGANSQKFWWGWSGWGTHVNPWLFHSNVWQNSLQKKKKNWWGWATLWGMEVIQMFVPFLFCHCTFILNEFWVLSLHVLSTSVERKIPSPTDVFSYEPKVASFSHNTVFIYALIDTNIPKTICK